MCVTAEPTSCTQPAVSWPGTNGSPMPAPFQASSNWPSQMWMSVRQKPAAATRTITSVGAVISGSGTSPISKSWR